MQLRDPYLSLKTLGVVTRPHKGVPNTNMRHLDHLMAMAVLEQALGGRHLFKRVPQSTSSHSGGGMHLFHVNVQYARYQEYIYFSFQITRF